MQFIRTIRAILDSKYNEIILMPDTRVVSRFPEFVYAWLNTFKYDDKKNQVV